MISVFGVSVHLYGFFIGLAILSALQMSLSFSKIWGVKKELVEAVFWWVVIGGVVGARAYHVFHLWREIYSFDPVRVFYIWNGGLGIWGAVIGGVIGLLCWKWLSKQGQKMKDGVSLMKLLDVMMVGLPLGQAVGRLGNWANGELYGKNGEPLFAWEAILNLVLFSVLWQIGKRGKKKEIKRIAGRITGVYLIGYGVIRIVLENFRPDGVIWRWQGVPMAVVFGVISIVIGLTISISRLMVRHDPRG